MRFIDDSANIRMKRAAQKEPEALKEKRPRT
jgi:hypothetical protein